MPPVISKKERFDDVGPHDGKGQFEWAYHGFNYEILIDGHIFKVRTYDSEPARATIISTEVCRLPELLRELVGFIRTTLHCEDIRAYSDETGAYRSIDGRTLQFEGT